MKFFGKNLAFPLFGLMVMLLFFLSLDQLCVRDANRRLPLYPGAVRLQEDHNGLRVRGIGSSLEVFQTQDSESVIEAWYQELAIDLLNSGRNRGVASLERWLEVKPDGEGVLIYNLSQCIL
jgi:hypothetical protein